MTSIDGESVGWWLDDGGHRHTRGAWRRRGSSEWTATDLHLLIRPSAHSRYDRVDTAVGALASRAKRSNSHSSSSDPATQVPAVSTRCGALPCLHRSPLRRDGRTASRTPGLEVPVSVDRQVGHSGSQRPDV